MGWREDINPSLKAEKLTRAPGLRIGSAPTATLRRYRKGRLYQNGFGACVGKALGRALHVGAQIDGDVDAPMPSTRHLYSIGRSQEYAGANPDTVPPLVDRGSYPALVLEAARKLGFVPWELDPFGPAGSKFKDHNAATAELADINARPPSTALRNGIDQSGLRWFDASYTSGEARSRAIADGMNAARPIPFIIGMDVDTPFLWHRGSEPIRDIDPARIEGGHMLEIVEILPGGHALIDNWWDDWGGVDDIDDGLGILHVDLLGSRFVRNVYGILSQPTFG
jgi:hypothetical protein